MRTISRMSETRRVSWCSSNTRKMVFLEKWSVLNCTSSFRCSDFFRTIQMLKEANRATTEDWSQPVELVWIDWSQKRRGWCFPSGGAACSGTDFQISVWHSHQVRDVIVSQRHSGVIQPEGVLTCDFDNRLTIFILASVCVHAYVKAEARVLRGGCLGELKDTVNEHISIWFRLRSYLDH